MCSTSYTSSTYSTKSELQYIGHVTQHEWKVSPLVCAVGNYWNPILHWSKYWEGMQELTKKIWCVVDIGHRIEHVHIPYTYKNPVRVPVEHSSIKHIRMSSRFSAFCDSTSLHGWPHIPGSSATGKIFWAITILAMGGLAVCLCTRCIFKSPSFEANLILTQKFQHREAVQNFNSVN